MQIRYAATHSCCHSHSAASHAISSPAQPLMVPVLICPGHGMGRSASEAGHAAPGALIVRTKHCDIVQVAPCSVVVSPLRNQTGPPRFWTPLHGVCDSVLWIPQF